MMAMMTMIIMVQDSRLAVGRICVKVFNCNANDDGGDDVDDDHHHGFGQQAHGGRICVKSIETLK